MACPALPTCGLAVAESERSLPDINLRIRALMTKLGFDEGESFVVRMTGDPQISSPAQWLLLLCNAVCSRGLLSSDVDSCWRLKQSPPRLLPPSPV